MGINKAKDFELSLRTGFIGTFENLYINGLCLSVTYMNHIVYIVDQHTLDMVKKKERKPGFYYQVI